MYVTLRPRFGPEHIAPDWPARCITCRQRGHRSWKAGITRSPAQEPVRATTSSLSSSTVRHTPSRASPIAATICRACCSVTRTSGADWLAPDGTAGNAAHHNGSSRAGSRCTVPRGPCIFTSESGAGAPHSAARTSARVALPARIPTDTSAADSTWACAPSIAPTTSATGVPSPADVARNCRSSRRALASFHVICKVMSRR